MTAFMYILRCADDSYYVGSARDLGTKLADHQLGEGGEYTAKRLPVALIYVERFDSILRAFFRAKRVKNWSRTKCEALMRGEIPGPAKAAKKRFW